jgi:hypothetical protein
MIRRLSPAPSVDHRINSAFDLAETLDPGLSIIPAGIDRLEYCAFEDPNGSDKIDAVLGEVALPFPLVLFERHCKEGGHVITDVNTPVAIANGGLLAPAIASSNAPTYQKVAELCRFAMRGG